ncbi:transcriptional regulator [Alicyclobacillus hesperidum subsp. aegles]|uniref:helix-turn-helix domain-containing protein n=1 Tax=Alicyclobacillus hesperidum TaxID=89784 RepID=UPI00222B053A|nr:helix-turn-helix domain-containing protein [Alicyclobacillus hesperidum]GLG02491.1 transcriptional regulator [Alicyclobacillus hesperidum subsp. aegles]
MSEKIVEWSDHRTFAALAHPLRFEMLQMLMNGKHTLTEMGKILNEKPGKLRFHLLKLIDAELVRLCETRVVGGVVEKYYEATVNRLVSVEPLDITEEVLDERRRLALTMVDVLTRQFKERLQRDTGGKTFFSHHAITIDASRLSEFCMDLQKTIQEHVFPKWRSESNDGESQITLDVVSMVSYAFPYKGVTVDDEQDDNRTLDQ